MKEFAAVYLERPVCTLIYWPHVISREIDLCEIALSRRKRAPQVRDAGANRSKTKRRKRHEIGELSSEMANEAIKFLLEMCSFVDISRKFLLKAHRFLHIFNIYVTYIFIFISKITVYH